MRKLIYVLVAAAVVLVLGLVWMHVSAHTSTPHGTVGKTLADLEAAYQGENNARARYLAFAEKADEQGSGQVASLFRSAAHAEEVHAANHAEVIKQLGGDQVAEIDAPEVRSTGENLRAAVQDESYERDSMDSDSSPRCDEVVEGIAGAAGRAAPAPPIRTKDNEK